MLTQEQTRRCPQDKQQSTLFPLSIKEQIQEQIIFRTYLQRALEALLHEDSILTAIQDAEKLKLKEQITRQKQMEKYISLKDSQILSQIKKCEEKLESLPKQVDELAELQKIKNDCVSEKNFLIEMISNIDQSNKSDSEIQEQEKEFDLIRSSQADQIKELNEELISVEGRIRIVCRIRPLLQREKLSQDCQHIIQVVDDYTVILKNPNHSSSTNQNEFDSITTTTAISTKSEKQDNNSANQQTYKCMRVFSEESTQKDIFDYLNFFLTSSTSGEFLYKQNRSDVCVLAYGPSGSGKTWTMFGNNKQEVDENPSNNEGIIPRSIQKLYENLNELVKSGWEHAVSVSFVELYNSKAKDLIKNDFLSPGKSEGEFLPVNHNDSSMVQQILDLYKQFSLNRIVRKTCHNKRSSRSHFIFTLKIFSTNKSTNQTQEGSLSLVDLAGSEKLDINLANGDAKKETVFINSSLSVLAQVLRRLQTKETPIPYRNSLLTIFLKRYLTPNSKTFMILNVSPNSKYFYQTQDTLSLATNPIANTKSTHPELNIPNNSNLVNSPDSVTTVKKNPKITKIYPRDKTPQERPTFYNQSPTESTGNTVEKQKFL